MQPNLLVQPDNCGMRRTIDVAGVSLVSDHAGALFLEFDRVLLVADLHFEKGSAYGARRIFLPPYDTSVTLNRLGALIARYRPRCVVALGDSFHDRHGSARITARDLRALEVLQRGRDWIWIAGNHDPDPPPRIQGKALSELTIGTLVLRHQPSPGPTFGEIAGHLHPIARVRGAGGSRRGRCFVSDGNRCIMPAFGAYAGGLNLRDRAFSRLFGVGNVTAHVLGTDRVYAVPEDRCWPDDATIARYRRRGTALGWLSRGGI